jgi:hypothetical protein
MAPEQISTTYDLGAHVLEISVDHTVLIATYVAEDSPITELVQLDREEVHKLLLALQEAFQ